MNRLSAEDRLDLLELYSRYAWALDTGDLAALVATFSEDGRVVDGDTGEGLGVHEFASDHWSEDGWPIYQHHLDQFVFEASEDGRSCKVTSYSMVTEWSAESTSIAFAGYTTDVCVLTQAGWRIQVRMFYEWSADPLPQKAPVTGTAEVNYRANEI